MKNIRYMIEAILIGIAFLFFKIMPVTWASATGGWIGRTVGPRLGASRKALTNLEKAMPEMDQAQREKTIRGMWDNLGRVIAEYPHLKKIIRTRTEIIGDEYIRELDVEKPCVFMGGHFANWELYAFYFNYISNISVNAVYRAPNNPYVGKILEFCRKTGKMGGYLPKSMAGTKAIVKTMKDSGRLAILIDQKYNQGIPVAFFGRPAMTSGAFAQLAEKFNAPIIPVRVERLKGCRFRLSLYPPFYTEGRSEADIILQAHGFLEDWIRQRPEQWLWLHRRWDSKALQE